MLMPQMSSCGTPYRMRRQTTVLSGFSVQSVAEGHAAETSTLPEYYPIG